jgi:hypothetical protein
VLRRTNIYLHDEQLRTLKRLGAQRGTAVSELIREAVNAWLRARRARVMDEDEWGKRFSALLGRRRRVARTIRPEENVVERDVDRAVKEVRRTRTARRR